MRNFKYLKILYWFSLLALSFFSHSQNLLDSDEGIILEGAWNMINGKELYKDFFEFVTPGSFYFIYLIWKIFYPSYWIAKIASLFLFWGTSFFIFKISNEIKKSFYNYLPPLIFVISSFCWPIINHNAYNLFFLTFSSFVFIKGLRTNNKINFIASGFLASLSIMFLQQKGLALTGTMTIYLLLLFFYEKNKQRLKQIFWFLSFCFLPLTLLFLKWPTQLLYENLINFALQNYIEVNKTPYGIFIFFLILNILIAIILKKQKNKKIYFLLLLQFGLLLTTLARPDRYHVLLIIFPIYSLLPILLEKIITIKSWVKYLYLTFIVITIFLIVYPFLLFIYFNPPSSTKEKTLEITKFIKENCPEKNDLFAAPFIPGLYFETRKLNFTPYYLLMTGLQNEEIFNEVKNLIEINQPQCIVMNYQIVEKFNYSKDNPVDKYITENYQLQTKIQNDLIFIKQ